MGIRPGEIYSALTACFQSPRSRPRQKLRKKNVHRILRIGLLDQASTHLKKLLEVMIMKWETPSYTDLRFGFEVTMYIYNR